MNFRSIAIAAMAFVAVVSMSGCSVGMAPSGMSREDAKDALEKSSPQDKIRYYAASPMPQAEKEKHYKEIEAKSGVKAADVLGGAPVTGQ